ncbi:leucine-rich repeat-containing protein 26-like [Bombina bombina]|uniref:leucine-rich repeat-containing protein 26-like n=1 Tax=Bombina bombina TaxID=8345 RepID=UPI00235AD055|nr:leucine-rich repeat-containing protein 26-like [Bombina bombina]
MRSTESELPGRAANQSLGIEQIRLGSDQTLTGTGKQNNLWLERELGEKVWLLLILKVFCCPEICTCLDGKVECSNKGFRFIPEIHDEDSHIILLAFNKIGTLKSLSFYKYQNLERLDLQHNVISSIHNQAFLSLHNLSFLDLSSNQLTYLNPAVFQPLSRLTVLNLGNNRISRISGSVLAPLVYLQMLYLHNNAFVNLQVDLLSNLPSLTHLRLDGNPWACSCQIQSLLYWMLDHEHFITEKERTLCAVPIYLDQYPLMKIERKSFHHCQDFFTLYEYLYFLLIGIALFIFSILLCFLTGSLVISYEHLLLQLERKPKVYKKTAVKRRENTVNGTHIPVFNI